MTKRERVIHAITHQNTGEAPYQIDFTMQARAKAARYLQDDGFDEKIGNHIYSCYYSGYPEEIRPDYFKDDFGVIWNRTGADKDIGVIDRVLLPQPDITRYTFPDPPADRIKKACEAVMQKKGDCFTLASIGFSLFERAWTLTSMEELLVYMVTEPDFVHTLFNAITEYNLRVLSIMMEYDFDGVYFGDDWGQQKGLIMGPVHWRAFIKPYLKRLYNFAHAHGKYVAQHSCGDISDVFPDLIEIGLNIYQTFQPEIYDIEEVKRRYGDRLTFWGGISTQRLLPYATPEEIADAVKHTLSVMNVNGGYIAAPTHAIPGDVPAENIAALIGALQHQEGEH